MRFLATSLGSNGNFLPLIRLSLALQQRGHEVIFLTQESARQFFNQTAFKFEAVITREELAAVTEKMPLTQSPVEKLQVAWDHLLDPVTRRLYAKIEELNIPGQTMILTAAFLPGARLASEKLGIPMASLFVTPWDNFIDGTLEETDEVLRQPISDIRAELGLPQLTQPVLTWSYSPQCMLALFPRWFTPGRKHWPKHYQQLPFLLSEPELAGALPHQAESFLQQHPQPLVFVYGTYNVLGEAFTKIVEEVCDRLGKPAIILGWYQPRPKDLPKHILTHTLLTLPLLLPRVSLFIHHGGIGTIAEGIRAGVPHIALPNSDQQRTLADIIVKLGIGAKLDLEQFATLTIVPQIEAVLNNSAIMDRCAALTAEFEGIQSWQHCADKVMEFAATFVNPE